MPATEFQRLSDGRERCHRCAQEAVDNIDQLKAIFQNAKALLYKYMAVTIAEDIEVYFITAAEMHRSDQSVFIPTASYDTRAIGRASFNIGNSFLIEIENGQPRDMILATMIHEMTHIWQFKYLDFERLKQDHGLILIEGHAMWAEITCLRAVNIAPAYCEREANRTDVYGQGYRTVLQILDTNNIDNAFHWMLEYYCK
jgi:hypothetical protein